MSRWAPERAWQWARDQGPLLGCNFIPSTAINQLEFWQAETFAPEVIDRELGWAAAAGMNTVRMYLHDLVWQHDPTFLDRVDRVLALAEAHGVRAILVLFDDCWGTQPRLGTQPAPRPSAHNSGWVQSPGEAVVLQGPSAWGRLEAYVRAVIGRFAHDPRVRLWDLYNEPGNGRLGERSLPLLEAVFRWARAVDPDQPLTAGFWFSWPRLNAFQAEHSDVVTFHCYEPPAGLKRWIDRLRAYGRPLVCTEWMARPVGSTVDACLPVFQAEEVGCLSWGLVAGKTNTVFPWPWKGGALRLRGAVGWLLDRWIFRPLPDRGWPAVWFHDLYWPDGRHYRPEEIAQLQAFGARKPQSTRDWGARPV